MNRALKIGLIIGGGAAGIIGVKKLLSLMDAKNKLSFRVDKYHSLGFSEGFLLNLALGTATVKFKADIILHNHGNETLQIEFPTVFIRRIDNKSEVGTSIPKKETITIAAKSSAKIQNIAFEIRAGEITDMVNISSLFTKGKAVFDQVAQNLEMQIFLVVNGVEIKLTEPLSEPANVGLVASGKRQIKDGSRYDYLFPAAKKSVEKVMHNAGITETVEWAGKVVKTHYREAAGIARYLQSISKNDTELFKNIFDFAYSHIQYQLDRPGVEMLRTPAATWADRKLGVDCDDFTIFIASILHNLGIKFEFRITKYGGRPNYQHIYIIVPVSGGKHVTIDPVLDTFNYEKPYSAKKDFDMQRLGFGTSVGLSGYSATNPEVDNFYHLINATDLIPVLNGLGTEAENLTRIYNYLVRYRNHIKTHPEEIAAYQNPKQAIEMIDYALKYWNTPQRDKALQILANAELKLISQGYIRLLDDNIQGLGSSLDGQFFQNLAKKIKGGAKKLAATVKKVNPLNIVKRNAFIVAMKINLFKLASRLKYGYLTEQQALATGDIDTSNYKKVKDQLSKVEKMFTGWGGNLNHLKTAILTGHGNKGKNEYGVGQLGEPMTIGTIMLAVGPVLIGLATVMKDTAIGKSKIQAQAEAAAAAAEAKTAIAQAQAETESEKAKTESSNSTKILIAAGIGTALLTTGYFIYKQQQQKSA